MLQNYNPHRISELTLQPGRGGVFNVTVDGDLIFSKKQTGRFPETGELTRVLSKLQADAGERVAAQ